MATKFRAQIIGEAASRVIEEIDQYRKYEHFKLTTKYIKKSWLGKLFTDLKYKKRCIDYHRERQRESAVTALFKANHCINNEVELTNNEINALHDAVTGNQVNRT